MGYVVSTIDDELLNPPPIVDHPSPKVVAPIDEVAAPVPAVSTGSPSSTTADQDTPSPSNSQTTPDTQPPIIPNDVEEDNHDIEVAHMGNDPYFGIPIPEVSSDQSSSSDSIHTITSFHTAAITTEQLFSVTTCFLTADERQTCDMLVVQDTRRITSGSMQVLGDRVISWSSKRQKSAAISSTKAEYIALSGCLSTSLAQFVENGVTRRKKYSELSATKALQADYDIKETNIILQGLPPEVYTLERECKLYDEFDKFAYKKGESLREFYLRFSLLLNDINIYNMKLEQFQKGDDPIDAINHMMSFLIAIVTSRYPTTNNQLRNSSNPRQQATINNGRVTLQPIHGRQTSIAAGTLRTYTPRASGNNSGKQRIVICFNCKGESHMSKQCTKPKRKRNDSWFKDKVLLVQAQASGQILHEEELAFLADPGILEAMPSSEQANVVNASRLKVTMIAISFLILSILIVSQQTLTLAEESRSKMLLKHKDNMMQEKIKQTDTTPIDYAALNKLYKDFETRFVPQTELSAEQAFWSHNSVSSSKPDLSDRPTNVEVPKELPKVSMVNTSLKKLKYHLANFDVAVKQHRVESKTFEVKMNQALNENERLLEQVMSKEIVNLIVNSSMDFASVNVHECEKCLKLETELQKDFVEKDIYDKLDNSISNQNAPSFDQLFELNELKAQSQEKDMVIKKLKERIKSLSGNMDKDKIKQDLEEIETINIELDHRSVEISDLNACLQEKVLVITTLKDELRKLKGKDLANNEVTHHPSDSEIYTEPITPKLLNKRLAHSAYIKHTQEEAAVLRDLVDHIKANYLIDPTLESSCKYSKLIQELLSKISKICPSINNSREQLVVVTPMNKVKRVRFTEFVTSSRNIIIKKASTSNLASNKPMLSSTGVNPSTSASGSQPSGNTKKDKILQTQSSTQMNKVEAHPRKVKSSLKNKDHVVAPKGTAHVQHSKLNANSELKCVKCNGCMLSDNHDLCVLDYINNVNARAKSKSAKKQTKRKVWKPTGKMFTTIGYIWRPTGRTFTIVGNACPLTRITTTTEAPLRKPVVLDNETSKPAVTLVYSRKPRNSKTNVPVSKSKVVQIVLWYLDSGCSKHMTGDRSQLTNFVNKFLGTVKFGNDHVAKILGYGDYQIGNVTISRVYYVEGLGHNLFSVGQFCDSNLEVAFRQHTCFIRNLEGVDLLTGSRGNNLYTLSLGDMMASSPICLLSKASKTKSWLWHRRLSHLNFGAINHLARHGLVRGLPKLKFEKDHLCSACAMGKSKKKPHKPKSEDTNQEKLYLLHMDLCGPMRVASVNGKKYILKDKR
ncbi:retrovirus-related pol polyprotein from transposon TNT 1-94 [Tanacetum coccineum]